jgi:endonuclease YncB( thermonuclease family)
MGLREFRELSIRLYGINAPEIHNTAQHEAGVAAREHLVMLLTGHDANVDFWHPVVVRTKKDQADKYGDRWEGVIWLEPPGSFDPSDFHFVPGGNSINAQMVTDGHAVAYFGGPR